MVNTHKPKLTSLQQGILRLLFIMAGSTLNAHQIAKLLGASQPAVSKALPGMEKSGLIVVTKENGRLSIQMNRDDHAVVWRKRVDNIGQIYESGLVQFFYDMLPEATVILFGSYASGEDTSTSDVDIAIIGKVRKDLHLVIYEKILQREIRINYYGRFSDIDKHLLNNILSGIVLKGLVEL